MRNRSWNILGGLEMASIPMPTGCPAALSPALAVHQPPSGPSRGGGGLSALSVSRSKFILRGVLLSAQRAPIYGPFRWLSARAVLDLAYAKGRLELADMPTLGAADRADTVNVKFTGLAQIMQVGPRNILTKSSY